MRIRGTNSTRSAGGGTPASTLSAPVGRSAEDWEFLGPEVVVVSSLPPARDGIARYTQQLVESLKRTRRVSTIGLAGRAGDAGVELRGGARILKLLKLTRRRQDVMIQWHPHYYMYGYVWMRLLTLVSFWVLARSRKLVVVLHEPHRADRRRPGARRIADGLEEAARRLFWGSAMTVVVHSHAERSRFTERFPARRGRVCRVVEHGAFFQKSVALDKGAARSILGISDSVRMALCIGFLSPHKGFDRAITAFAAARGDHAQLYVVGTPIGESPLVDAHVDELRRLIDGTPNATLVEEWVDDCAFDTWIQAADVVLLPYRSASSSGVAARASLLGTPIIASAVGALPEQRGVGGAVVESDDELRDALENLINHGDAAPVG